MALGLSFSPPIPLIPFWLLPYCEALGVGSEQEETIAEVRGTDGRRGYTVPFRSPPARSQVPEDLRECSASVNGEEAWDVFDEEPRRLDLDGDPPDFRPEPSSVLCSESLSCDACSLTWKTGSDDIHSSAIRAAVEGFQIVEDRTWIHGTLCHSISEDRSRVGLPLNSTHKPNSGASESDGELKPAVSGAEGEASPGTNSSIGHDISPQKARNSTFDISHQVVEDSLMRTECRWFHTSHSSLVRRICPPSSLDRS